ncbi:DNA sulfur modification protein DndB [Methylobacterium brachythecii]|nr:DNA sulfur modification protein DndB [Methylobacterium brachythecii]MBB3905677.1 DNA sulfur modification protein DndB [Methylobacterium brachythecii]
MVQINLPDPPIAEGVVVFGASISDTEFQGAMPHGLFKTVVPDPRNLEGNATKYHTDLSEVAELRLRVNRLVTGAKKKNVLPYANYMIRMVKSGEGFTPQIVLWSQKRLRVEKDPGTGLAWLLIPHGMKFIALDGDTQTTARHLAEARESGLFEGQKVKIVIVHDIPEDVAQQIFADCNSRGTKVVTSMAIGFDNRDPATQLAKYVERHVPALHGRVNRQKRQLSARDIQDVVTMSALRASVVCFVEGISGIQHQTQAVEIDDSRLDVLQVASACWYSDVTTVLNGALTPEERETNFASAPAVWCALGALGHDVLERAIGKDFSGEWNEDKFKRASQEIALNFLAIIDWQRGVHWTKVGAKKSQSGAVTLGGPKEVGSLIYKALRDRALATGLNFNAA